jgi:hypothetical protein
MARSRSMLSQYQRNLYLASRALGTVRAAGRGPGPLAKRLVRRRVTRVLFGGLRKAGWW